MNPESVFGTVIMFLCSFGSGGLFYGIGRHALHSDKPMGFWANGPEIKPGSLTDVGAYNQEIGRMWQIYSIPYFLSALFAVLSGWNDNWAIVYLILLVIACTFGIWWLIRSYQRIINRYRRLIV